MENLNEELYLEELAEVTSKGHYETVKEYTREVPAYDNNGNFIGMKIKVTGRDRVWVTDDPQEIVTQQAAKRSAVLKAELEKIKEDIEQETFGLVRDDFAAKKARAAEIINELRVLEGKEPREIKND